jgi:hypothetical protein
MTAEYWEERRRCALWEWHHGILETERAQAILDECVERLRTPSVVTGTSEAFAALHSPTKEAS